MSSAYSSSDIEVLSGLDPVRMRPGMYTDTTRPNHLAQEVIEDAAEHGLVLSEHGKLYDTKVGQALPDGVEPMPLLTEEELSQKTQHGRQNERGGEANNR